MNPSTSLLDLPVELLLSIFAYLDVSSFLSLTSTCKALNQPELVYDAAYWSTLVRTTFRVPNQPVVEKDGMRWQKLFKRMLTQSRIYTWGNNEKACLGHSYELPSNLQGIGPPGTRRHNALRRRHISWPERMERVHDLGVVSDLQAGGWSTTLLTANGALYTCGAIDGLQFNAQKLMTEPVPLRYPPGFPHPYDYYQSSTAIKQFSAGRAHVLALSDSGRIWSWQNIEHSSQHVKFLNHDTLENVKSGRGAVKKVVAGWNKSAALIEGYGIVLWEPLQRDDDETAIEDAALVLESAVVPQTSFQEMSRTASRHAQHANIALQGTVGMVQSFVVLEEVVLFNTTIGKVFVAQIFWNDHEQRIDEPVQLPLPKSCTGERYEGVFATDVQGSFHSFAVFTRDGAVLTSTQDRLMDLLEHNLKDRPLFTDIPALQHKDVIQVAFGDYHFHALHAPGYITSYGTEPHNCGALGLGGHGDGEGRLRGIRYQGVGGDGRLVPHAYAEGRRVWFEREKRAWITFLTSGGVDPAESILRERMAIGSPGVRCQGEVSEWVEQQGRDWETKFGVRDDDDDGLAAYFALSVTAAGWHSGAVVLVNDQLADRLKRACEIPDAATQDISPDATSEDGSPPQIEQAEDEAPSGIVAGLLNYAIATGSDWGRWFLGMSPYNAPTYRPNDDSSSTPEMHSFKRGMHPINYGASPRVGVRYVWANDHFPRLKLSDGTEMPGSVPFDEWRYERPEWDLDFSL